MSDSSPLDDVKADQASVAADKRPFPKHWIVLGLLLIANAAFGAYFNPNGKNSSEVGEKTAFMLTGFLCTQPFLFALWAAFAPHRFYRRFLWALLLCSLVAFAEELGTLLGNRNTYLGFGMAVQLILFILFTSVLLMVRRFFGWRFNRSQTEFMPSDYQANQFGIKHLILLTTITGIAFALIRSLRILNSFNRLPSVVSVLASTGFFSAMIIPIMIVPWFTMTFRGNTIKLIVLATVLLGIFDPLSFLIVQQPIPPLYFSFGEVLRDVLLMQLGGCLSVLLNTIVLRLCGYRLIRERKSVSSSQALGQ